MTPYLQPEDDGLVMRPAGPWATEKLDYLRRYIDVFETSMRSKWGHRNYIDLLAGPGKNLVEETGAVFLGSPLLALTTAHPFTHYYFTEHDTGNYNALQQRCSASPHQKQVSAQRGDCNLLVTDIVAKIKPLDGQSLNLAFLDPEGFELKWSTVEQLATLRRIDLIINYPQGGLNRYMQQASSQSDWTSVDDFFGDTAWRMEFEEAMRHGDANPHWRLIEFYRRRLQGLGYVDVLRDDEVGDEPLIRNAKRKAPLYRLLFASKHPLGHTFWHRITRKGAHGQPSLL